MELYNKELSDNIFFSKRYSGLQRLFFWVSIYKGYSSAYFKLFLTLLLRKCYYGPFKGEFGHLLAHNLPFIMYLHSKKVKVFYCGVETTIPFLIDQNGKNIIYKYYKLRDFFKEIPPNSNSTVPKKDVQEKIDDFTQKAQRSIYPFWNINNDFYYWFIHRNWLLKGPFMKTYDLSHAYQTEKFSAVTIFSRKENKVNLANNGDNWDYNELAKAVSPYFDKVYITGHPSKSEGLIKSVDNIEVCISANNKVILEKCSNSQLIITQHSGAAYLGEYTNCKVLIIYKGQLPIGSLQNTLRFKPYIGEKYNFEYAFSQEDVLNFVKKHYRRSHEEIRN